MIHTDQDVINMIRKTLDDLEMNLSSEKPMIATATTEIGQVRDLSLVLSDRLGKRLLHQHGLYQG